MDFSTRTRQDFINFDTRRNEVSQPTPKEIAEQEAIYKQNLINRTKDYLNLYWIEFTWEEKDFSWLWTEYIKWIPAMNEWLGKDERLEEIVALKIKENNNLLDFCNFIIQYES